MPQLVTGKAGNEIPFRCVKNSSLQILPSLQTVSNSLNVSAIAAPIASSRPDRTPNEHSANRVGLAAARGLESNPVRVAAANNMWAHTGVGHLLILDKHVLPERCDF